MLNTAADALSFEEIIAQCRSEQTALLRLNFGISYLDDATLGLFPGDLCLIGARTGGGKTEFATQVLLTQTALSKNVLYFALDHDKGEIEHRITWRQISSFFRKNRPKELIGIPLRYAEWRAGNYRDFVGSVEREARLRVSDMLSKYGSRFIYRKGEFTGAQIAEVIKAPGFSSEYSLCIVDHFHAIRTEGNQFESQSKAIRALAEAAQIAERPVLVMGQFRKRNPSNKSPLPDEEEFSGHSDVRYLPQTIIVFAPKHTESVDRRETYFHVTKSRIASDSKVFVGVHSFDTESNSYSPKYTVSRSVPYGEPVDLSAMQYPAWAKNAQRPRF